MPLDIPPGFMQCAIQMRHSSDPEPWITTFGVNMTGFGGGVNDALLRAASSFTANWIPVLSNAVTVVKIIGVLGTNTGENLTVERSVGLQGTASGATLPQNCALLIKKQTNTPGRRGRGRMFLPGVLRESEVSDVGIITTSVVELLQERADQFVDDLAASSGEPGEALPMVVLHNEGVDGVDPSDVLNCVVDSLISTQRRRMRR